MSNGNFRTRFLVKSKERPGRASSELYRGILFCKPEGVHALLLSLQKKFNGELGYAKIEEGAFKLYIASELDVDTLAVTKDKL